MNISRPSPIPFSFGLYSSGMRFANSSGSTLISSTPRSASNTIMSPFCTFAIGPPREPSGLTWIADGTLPLAPDIRPSVTNATLKPLSCKTASGGVSVCNSGMPFAAGPWNRTIATKSLSNSPASNAAFSASWESNTIAGASTMRCSGFTADTLLTPKPIGPSIIRSPPSLENGSDTGRNMSASALVSGAGRQAALPSSR